MLWSVEGLGWILLFTTGRNSGIHIQDRFYVQNTHTYSWSVERQSREASGAGISLLETEAT